MTTRANAKTLGFLKGQCGPPDYWIQGIATKLYLRCRKYICTVESKYLIIATWDRKVKQLRNGSGFQIDVFSSKLHYCVNKL